MYCYLSSNSPPHAHYLCSRYANYFQDDLTLDNMPRMQLINLCKYMSIPPYGSDAFLRFQLRHRIRVLKEDDQRILWEGIDSLTKMELREACQERGMRSTGLSKDAYKRSLQQWLDLSVNKNVPISLLIMSRTFFLREEMFEKKTDDDGAKSLAGLADAISGLDKEVLNEVILEVATSEEKLSDPEIRKIKLEVLAKQNELIQQEQAAREAASKRKEAEKAEASSDAAAAVNVSESSSSSVGAAPSEEPRPVSATLETKKESSEEDRQLSASEMDAISHLVSDDPVSKERAELERIKAAIRAKERGTEDAEADTGEVVPEVRIEHLEDVTKPTEIAGSLDAERVAAKVVEDVQERVMREADSMTTLSLDGKDLAPQPRPGADEEDPVVAKLKKRIESMVDKIEVQLSHVQVKIGDKLHFLDKDRDGVLSREEMAEVLQQVLKREITFDEAMEIASEMVRAGSC